MKRLLILTLLLLLVAGVANTAQVVDFNPKFNSIRVDTTGANARVTIRAANGDTLGIHFLGIDSCAWLKQIGDTLFYKPCNSADTTRIQPAGAGGGTSDSIGYDTNGTDMDGYLFPSYFREGTSIVFDVLGDTLTISGPAGSGTIDSFMVDLTNSWTADSTWMTPDDTLHIDTTDADTHLPRTFIFPGFRFDATTTNADPGPGDVRFNSGTPASVTEIYIDDATILGHDAIGALALIDTGYVIAFYPMSEPGLDGSVYRVTATEDSVGFLDLTVTHLSSGLIPSAGDTLLMTIVARDVRTAATGTDSVYVKYMSDVAGVTDGWNDTVYVDTADATGSSADTVTVYLDPDGGAPTNPYVKWQASTASGTDTLAILADTTNVHIWTDSTLIISGKQGTTIGVTSAAPLVFGADSLYPNDSNVTIFGSHELPYRYVNSIGFIVGNDTVTDITGTNLSLTAGVLSASGGGDDTVLVLGDVSSAPDDKLHWGATDKLLMEDTTANAQSLIFGSTTDFLQILADSGLTVGDTTGGAIRMLGEVQFMVDTATSGDVRVMYAFDTLEAGGPTNGDVFAWDGTHFELQAQTGGAGSADTVTFVGGDSTVSAVGQEVVLKFGSGITAVNSGDNPDTITITASGSGTISKLGVDTGDGSQAAYLINDTVIVADGIATFVRHDDQTIDTIKVDVDTTVVATRTYADQGIDSIGVDVDGGAMDTWDLSGFGLREGANITFTMTGDTLTIAGAAAGEANTISDTGTFNGTSGFGLAGGKTGTAVKVKGLIEGSNITITASGDSAYSVAASGGGDDTVLVLGDVSSAPDDKLHWGAVDSLLMEDTTSNADNLVFGTITDRLHIVADSGLTIGDTTTIGDPFRIMTTPHFRSDTSGGYMDLPFKVAGLTVNPATAGDNYVWAWESAVDSFVLQAQTGGAGEANTISAIGETAANADSLTAGKSGNDLRVKSLVAGTNITLTPSDTTLLIDATDTGDEAKVDTSGVGTNVVTIGGELVIQEGANITLAMDSDTLTITGAASSGTVDSVFGISPISIIRGVHDTVDIDLSSYETIAASETLIADSLDEYSLSQWLFQPLTYRFSTGTTDVDPGSGVFSYNNATQGISTQIFADDDNVLGNLIDSLMLAIDIGYYLRLQAIRDQTKFIVWVCDGATVDATGYGKIQLGAPIESGTAFGNNDTVLFQVFVNPQILIADSLDEYSLTAVHNTDNDTSNANVRLHIRDTVNVDGMTVARADTLYGGAAKFLYFDTDTIKVGDSSNTWLGSKHFPLEGIWIGPTDSMWGGVATPQPTIYGTPNGLILNGVDVFRGTRMGQTGQMNFHWNLHVNDGVVDSLGYTNGLFIYATKQTGGGGGSPIFASFNSDDSTILFDNYLSASFGDNDVAGVEGFDAETLYVGVTTDTTNLWITSSSTQTGQIVFRDSVTGVKTLAQLAAGGADNDSMILGASTALTGIVHFVAGTGMTLVHGNTSGNDSITFNSTGSGGDTAVWLGNTSSSPEDTVLWRGDTLHINATNAVGTDTTWIMSLDELVIGRPGLTSTDSLAAILIRADSGAILAHTDGSVDSNDLAPGAIDNTDLIADDVVAGADIAPAVAGAGLVQDGSGNLDVGAGTGITVNANDIAATLGTDITLSEMAANSVDSDKVVNGSISSSDIGPMTSDTLARILSDESGTAGGFMRGTGATAGTFNVSSATGTWNLSAVTEITLRAGEIVLGDLASTAVDSTKIPAKSIHRTDIDWPATAIPVTEWALGNVVSDSGIILLPITRVDTVWSVGATTTQAASNETEILWGRVTLPGWAVNVDSVVFTVRTSDATNAIIDSLEFFEGANTRHLNTSPDANDPTNRSADFVVTPTITGEAANEPFAIKVYMLLDSPDTLFYNAVVWVND